VKPLYELTLLDDQTMGLSCPYEDHWTLKGVQGVRFNPRTKTWTAPLRIDTYDALVVRFPAMVVSEEVKARIEDLKRLAGMIQAEKDKGWKGAKPIEPMPVMVKPFDHQIQAYNIGLQIPNIALLMEQGCGKTLTAIAIATRRFERGEIKRVLVVAPASVVPVWPKEFRDYAKVAKEVRTLSGSTAQRIKALEAPHVLRWEALKVAVINYEGAWRMEGNLAEWVEAEPTLVICDESQRIKTPTAKQSKAMHRIGQAARYRMILTGTPVTQSPMDFFSQYKFLDPSIFGSSFYAFRSRYAKMGGYGNYQVVGYRNLPDLVNKAHSIAYRVTKADALDLPEFMDQTLYCALEPEARRAYEALRQESVADLEGEARITAPNVLTRLLRLSQLTGGYLGDDEKELHKISGAKLELLAETLDDLLTAGHNVVIFARFLPEIAAIAKMVETNHPGAGLECITGEVPIAERGAAVDRFQAGESRVFIAQLATAGLGITLTAADVAIFYSLDFSFANYDQCRARIHRIGQHNPCTYIHLVADRTVDEKVLAALSKKRDVADDVVDNWRTYLKREDD
jgi:SNF2 family DNA or RNA helicase